MLTVDSAVAHAANNETVPDPVAGIINVADPPFMTAYLLLPVQPPPVKEPFVASKTNSPDVEDS